MPQFKMDKKAGFKNIYKESFEDTPDFIEFFFNKVYHEDEAIMLDIDNTPVSALLLHRYSMNFHGKNLPVGYICAAATARRMRGRGYMSELILESIRRSYDNGDFLMTLVPANSALYRYYSKFGFSSVFFISEERYASAHKFDDGGGIFSFDIPPTDSRVKDKFQILSNLRQNSVLHGPDDFDIIVGDNELDGGEIISAYNILAGTIDAVAVAIPCCDMINIREILSVSSIAREALLAEISKRFGNLPIRIITAPDNNGNVPIEIHGMGRIVDVRTTLEAIASESPDFSAAFRVHDNQLAQNSHTYIINNGTVEINDSYKGRLDLDISQEVLTSIIFSAPKMGAIFNLHTSRPFMPLMLE